MNAYASTDDDRGGSPVVVLPREPTRRPGLRLRALGVAAGVLSLLALGAAVVLLVLDFTHGFLTSGAHAVLSATPLAVIALAYLAHRSLGQTSLLQWLKVLLLAAAFLLWGAYQLFPGFPKGQIFNDLAIGLSSSISRS